MSETNSSFNDADIEVCDEIIHEPISYIQEESHKQNYTTDPHARPNIKFTLSEILGNYFIKKLRKAGHHQLKTPLSNGSATHSFALSPQVSSSFVGQIQSPQLSVIKEPHKSNRKSFQPKKVSMTIIPEPKREYTWKDGLRSKNNSSFKKHSIGSFFEITSFAVSPNDTVVEPRSEIHERLYKQTFQLKKKREEIYDPKKQERLSLQTFTFSPNRIREADSVRTSTQFFEDQKKLQKEKEERLEILKSATETFKIVPAKQISKEQAEQTKIRAKLNVEWKKQKIIEEHTPQFKPVFFTKTAQIASNRQSVRVSSPRKKVVEQPINSAPVQKAKKTESMVYQKFKRDYDVVIKNLGVNQALDQETVIALLTELGFVSKAETLSHLLLTLFSGKTAVQSKELFQVLCEMQQFQPQNSSERLLSQQMVLKLFPLVLNRKNFLGKMKVQKVTNEYKTQLKIVETLSPRLNTAKNAKILAQSKTAQLKERLISDQKVKTEILNTAHDRENLQWIKKQLSELEMLDCTFKPKTNVRMFSAPRVYDQPLIKSKNRATVDIEFENQQRECTFKPIINPNKSASRYVPRSNGDIISPGKTQQPSQLKQKKDNLESNQFENQFINLSVRISDVESRQLVIESEDQFQTTVRKFCQFHGLDKEQEQKLQEVISLNTGWPIQNKRESV